MPSAGLVERVKSNGGMARIELRRGWAMTPAGMCGVVNDALGIYLLDATLASAFVARWHAGYKVESAEGVFRVREDAPE